MGQEGQLIQTTPPLLQLVNSTHFTCEPPINWWRKPPINDTDLTSSLASLRVALAPLIRRDPPAGLWLTEDTNASFNHFGRQDIDVACAWRRKLGQDRLVNSSTPDKASRRPFTEAEDLQLIRAIRLHGTKWTEIAREFEQRSEVALRNRYYSSLRKKLEPTFGKRARKQLT